MDKTKEFLQQNRESFELYAHFEDHNVYYYAIEEKITADNCIETCKSLIEGISKTILEQVDLKNESVRNRFAEHEVKSLETTFNKMAGKGEDFPVIFKQAVVVLSNYHISCHKGLLDSLGKDFCKYLSRLRNERGDISHGRASPKRQKSSLDLAYMIERVTDLITFHMLEIFSLIDFRAGAEEEEVSWIEEAFMIKPESDLVDINDQERLIRDFNTRLDKQNPIGEGLSYSWALFQQRKEEYLILLNDYELEQKAETI